MGGHGIPEDVIRRRFTRSAQYFVDMYAPLADAFCVLDTTDDDEALIISTSDEHGLAVRDVERWTHLKHLGPLLTPPINELRTALRKSARLQRRLALAYGIHLKKPKQR